MKVHFRIGLGLSLEFRYLRFLLSQSDFVTACNFLGVG